MLYQFVCAARRPRVSVVVTVCSLAVSLAASIASAQNCDQFQRLPSPNSGTDANVLLGVAAVNAQDAWAVGYRRDGTLSFPLSLRYDGTQWNSVTMPVPTSSPASPAVTLTDARAFSASEAWAVGFSVVSGSLAQQTLVYRWNGSAWTVVPSAVGCCGPVGSALYCVDGVSASDFWVVGDISTALNVSQPLAARWNGTAWEEYRLPRSSTAREAIKDLHVRASNDIWALEGIGIFSPSSPRRILHWNGTAWSEGAAALNPARYTAAEAIHAFGPSDIWVSSVVDGTFQTVMLHWNGSAWTEFNVPVLAYQFFAMGANDLYAVGYASIMHWNGSAWSVVQSVPGQGQINFFDTELATDGTIWSAGSVQPGATALTLTARLAPCGCIADFTRDGSVNTMDFFEFVDALLGQEGRADLNRDGRIDTADYFVFVEAFFAGC